MCRKYPKCNVKRMNCALNHYNICPLEQKYNSIEKIKAYYENVENALRKYPGYMPHGSVPKDDLEYCPQLAGYMIKYGKILTPRPDEMLTSSFSPTRKHLNGIYDFVGLDGRHRACIKLRLERMAKY